ncbi:MAG TPA: FAD-dependent monooxygenase, partial [Gemmatimonadaceae bacterium]
GAGISVESVNLFAPSGRSVAALFNNRSLDTQYANILVLPQDETERILGELVVHTGGTIERGVELTELTQDASAAHITLRHTDGHTEQIDVDWVAGCDGAHSTVRRLVGAAFPGVTYSDECLLGDVFLDWKIPEGQISLCPQKDGFLIAFPLRGEGHFRIIMVLPRNEVADERRLEQDEFFAQLARMTPPGMGANGGPPVIERTQWLTRYRLHRRGVTSDRDGRAFLAGDAAHIHSPVGGQGMNTGIQDAYNLAWKLALVVRGESNPALLDTYDAERHRIGEILLQGTDRLFAAVAGHGRISTFIRTYAPVLAGRAFNVPMFSRRVIRFMSELGIRYRQSPLSREGPGAGALSRHAPHAGDRAPDAPLTEQGGTGRRLFDLFRGPHHTLLEFDGESRVDQSWSVTLRRRYGHLVRAFVVSSRGLAQASDAIDDTGAAHKKYGAERGGIFLIRPDGYIAFRGGPSDRAALEADLAVRFPAARSAKP